MPYEEKLNIDIPGYQKEMLVHLKEGTGVPLAELVRRAIDTFLLNHRGEFRKMQVLLPDELRAKDEGHLFVAVARAASRTKK
jgi:hypothetical protein